MNTRPEKSIFHSLLFLTIAGVLLLPAYSNALPAYYTVTDMGTLPEGYVSWGYGINNNSQAVGVSCSETESHAFVWETGILTDIGTLGGGTSQVNGLNDTGQAVGASTGGANTHAFIWQNGIMTDLGTLGGSTSQAHAINNSGQVVGFSNTGTSTHAFIWHNNIMTDLGAPGTGYSYAFAINDSGKVAGYTFENGHSQAVLWENNSIIPLTASESRAYGINNTGRIVGCTKNESRTIAFLWENGILTDLDTPENSSTFAYAVNDSGQSIGHYIDIETGLSTACIWEKGTLHDLNSLLPENTGWALLAAQDINESGQIVGYGSFNGNTRAFLLTPAISVTFEGLLQIIKEKNLYSSTEKSLLKHVTNAQTAAEANNREAAVFYLEQFIEQVSTKKGTKLSNEDIAGMVDYAADLIESL